MRFVKTQKHTLSSATTKGWSGKNSHHPKRSETPVEFVGVDGEGMTVNGEHRYVLFGVGEDQISDANGLQWQDVFSFLYKHHRPGTAYVGFYLGYDFTQLFKGLPIDKAWLLLTSEGRALRKHRIPGKAPHPVECDGWQFDILAMKRLRIRPKTCQCPTATCRKGSGCKHAPWLYLCDVGSFFQSSFLTVINPEGWQPGTEVVTQAEYDTIRQGKEKRSTAVLDDEMMAYNRLENEVLVRVMKTLDAGFHEIGIHLPPSKWFGPGQAAQAWLKGEGVPTRVDLAADIPEWFLEVARMSYYGGWFELFIHGIIPGDSHEYDINSAYPSIIAILPCLRHGTYTRGEGLPPKECNKDGSLCLVYGSVWSPGMPTGSKSQHVGTMLHRDKDGSILRPMATEGWFWWDELKAAERAGLVKRLDNKGKQQIKRWVRYVPCDCPPPMRGIADLYGKRLAVGKKSPLGKAAKTTYNSGYGKFAQSVGDPIFGNPIYASRITSGCRTMILNAIATHPKGKANVSMVATDAVYFLSPHPGLNVSEALGEWDHKVRSDLTLFKPGVYWDNGTREQIAKGDNPNFKARGFQAADFVTAIGRIDSEFRQWSGGSADAWPTVSFTPRFSMTTALQALRRNAWETAGVVESEPPELTQNSNPWQKRIDKLDRCEYEGRVIYRSRPYDGVHWPPDGSGPEWIPTTPYEKRFGMDDPWSDDYKSQYGITEDGNIVDILAWILTGE